MDIALRACGLHGHVTYAPDDPEVRKRLHTDTAHGEAWRCLRCDGFVVGQPTHTGPPPTVLRGKAIRDRFITRLLALERIVRTVLFALLAFGVFRVRDARVHLQAAFEKDLPLLRPLADQFGWNPDSSKLVHEIDKAFSLSSTALTWVALGLAAYALIELIEAVGLWLGHRWGEYFAVVATSVFLPLEIYELTEKVTVFKLVALAINIAAVVWLLWSKRLFGLNGGGRAYRDEHAELDAVSAAAGMPA
ncbi:DUF2127 domain-containing protein [Tsukamurella sp. 8F]|uniref:DUF2127 domain-containing protein n=1 Tax=unclassified Tsukamurella TaxID=2633480 RepID=UPI0023B900B0|nr:MULTISPECIES: DUF2127 domain-containing protein [unclassified Tsukamurella]MDF0529952.1 DUF2127 domain-containing protein [Tsukamurella sp. 8J]MDF0587276.1 DUF2127 domain-containing protein [Tsukamurella sp. 8F]